MRNDQIFVLMLVILLPMSGCFDGAVGDAEAEDGSEEGTVINNYYTVSTNEIYSTGGTGLFDYENASENQYPKTMVFTIVTNSSEMIKVVQSQLDGVWNGGQYIMYTNCSQGASFSTGIARDYTESGGHLPDSFDSCTHELVVGASYWNQEGSFSWSFSYQIIDVTVI